MPPPDADAGISGTNSQGQLQSHRHDPVPLCMAKKWLPVSHRHGCAIYRHQNVSAQLQDVVGGELMVSAIVRGTPEQCLAALTSSTCSNSILGPATAVEVLSGSGADSSSKVLRITLASPFSPSTSSDSTSTSTTTSRPSSRNSSSSVSMLARLCSRVLRRRCAVVQQTLWRDPKGIHCITFRSLLEGEEHQQQQQQAGAGLLPALCNGDVLPQQHVSGSQPYPNHHLQDCSQQQQQQQLRHRSVTGALGKAPAKQQQGARVQVHASCQHSSSTGASANSSSSGSTSSSHAAHHQQQQQTLSKATAAQQLLQPLRYLLAWLSSLLLFFASLMGLSCSSSSGGCWGWLWDPVPVTLVGGFTVAGLEGASSSGDDSSSSSSSAGAVGETLVTSILKVDLGGCLAAGRPGGLCSLLHTAAVRSGVVDVLVGQMLSAVERVKAEVEHPPGPDAAAAAALTTQQQQATTTPGSSSSALQGLLSALASVASLALAPLTTWQAQQHQQQQQGTRPNPQPWLQRQGSPSLQQQQQRQQSVGGSVPSSGGRGAGATTTSSAGGGRSGGGGGVRQRTGGGAVSSSGGGGRQGQSSCEAAEGSAAAAGGGGGDGGSAEQLVGLDQEGQPLTGLCNPAFWSPLHQPGCPSLFQVRGPHYLSDHVKIKAGPSAYTLLAVDLVSTPSTVHHLARFLPSVRRSRAASAFVINMMVPAAHDVMNLVMTFGSSRPWPVACSSSNGNSSSNGSNGNGSSSTGSSGGSGSGGGGSRGGSGGGSGGCSSSSSGSGAGGSSGSSSGAGAGGDSGEISGFEHALSRFLQSNDHGRSNMFKMIPHIEVGPWVVQGMVGTTPVIMGRKLETTYHLTERYVEVDIDVTTCRTAGFIVQSIRGATTSLVVDLCYLLEGQQPQELPEVLIGAVRFSNIDMSATTPVDTTTEIPSWPQPW